MIWVYLPLQIWDAIFLMCPSSQCYYYDISVIYEFCNDILWNSLRSRVILLRWLIAPTFCERHNRHGNSQVLKKMNKESYALDTPRWRLASTWKQAPAKVVTLSGRRWQCGITAKGFLAVTRILFAILTDRNPMRTQRKRDHALSRSGVMMMETRHYMTHDEQIARADINIRLSRGSVSE